MQRMSVKFTSQQLLPDAKLSVPEIGTKAHERHAKKMEKQSIRWLKSQRHKIKVWPCNTVHLKECGRAFVLRNSKLHCCSM